MSRAKSVLSELLLFGTVWTRLPIQLSVSFEIFQMQLIQTLEGLPGVTCIMTDMLIYMKGSTQQ